MISWKSPWFLQAMLGKISKQIDAELKMLDHGEGTTLAAALSEASAPWISDGRKYRGLANLKMEQIWGCFWRWNNHFAQIYQDISGLFWTCYQMLSDVIIFWWHLFGPSSASNYLHPSQWLVNLLLILRWIRSFRDTISILHVENVYPQKLGNIFIFSVLFTISYCIFLDKHTFSEFLLF